MSKVIVDWVEHMPTAGDKVLVFLGYVFGTAGGGLLFPAVYSVLLWKTWDHQDLTSGWHWLFVGLGAFLSIAALFYPCALDRYLKRRASEVAQIQAAFDALPVVQSEEMRSLKNAIERLADKLS